MSVYDRGVHANVKKLQKIWKKKENIKKNFAKII